MYGNTEGPRRSAITAVVTTSAGLGIAFTITLGYVVLGMVESGSYGFGLKWSAAACCISGVCGAAAVVFKKRAYRFLQPRNTEPTKGRISLVGVIVLAGSLVMLAQTYLLYKIS